MDVTPLINASGKLVRGIRELSFSGRIAYVYDPLVYAWEPYKSYLQMYAQPPKRVLFFGMNPGPWGMAQTGVPFGEIDAVRGWLGIEKPVGKPPQEHPDRPVLGFDCHRREVSGKRVWGLMQERFGKPDEFFKEHFIGNYCPLLFFDANGKNLTPDKLVKKDRENLFQVCDEYAAAMIQFFTPRFLVGFGKFAYSRLEALYQDKSESISGVEAVIQLLHPSPANPKANRGWAEEAVRALEDAGVW